MKEKSPCVYVNTGIDLWRLALVNKSKFSLKKKLINILSRSLGPISFLAIHKSCNHVAQTLVGFAKEKEEASIWLEECPSFLSPFVQFDLSH